MNDSFFPLCISFLTDSVMNILRKDQGRESQEFAYRPEIIKCERSGSNMISHF